jgi:omega-amidase
MHDLKVALVQADQAWEDKTKNYAHYSELLAGLEQVDLILLPEMFNTGFSMNAAALAEEKAGVGVQWLKDLASEKNCAVYTSMITSEGGAFFNRAYFVLPDGKMTTYDKRKCFGLAGEDLTYSSGEKETIAEYKGWKFNLQICYDLRFPEIVRNKILSNGLVRYDVILYVANWPKRRSLHWKTLLQARAIENQCYVLGTNRVGLDGSNLEYSGDSMVVGPLGEVKAAEEGKEEIVIGELSAAMLSEVREKLPFLKDA